MSKLQFELPNVRKLFIPDPGYVIIDLDLAGADARVVAWECGGKFKEDFFGGIKIHVQTMQQFFPGDYARSGYEQSRDSGALEPNYTKCKNMAFGTTYGGGYRAIAAAASLPASIVQRFQPWWFEKYPTIRTWQRTKETELYSTRGVSNQFGYRIHYFDRIEGLLPEALAWVPQSTVAIVCFRGARVLKQFFPFVQILINVHDSLLVQLPSSKIAALREIHPALEEVSVPYSPEPLRIPWGVKGSYRSWGHVKPVNLSTLEIAA